MKTFKTVKKIEEILDNTEGNKENLSGVVNEKKVVIQEQKKTLNEEKDTLLVMRNENFSLKTTIIKNKLDEIIHYIGNVKKTALSLEEKTQYLLKLENEIISIEKNIEVIKKEYDIDKKEKNRIFEKVLELKTILKVRNDDFDTIFLKIKDLTVYEESMEKVSYKSIVDEKKNSINNIINEIENIEIELLTMELNKIKHNEVFTKIDIQFNELIEAKKLLEKEKIKLNTSIREKTKTIGTLEFKLLEQEKDFIEVEAIEEKVTKTSTN